MPKGARFFDKATTKKLKQLIALTHDAPMLHGATDAHRLECMLVRWYILDAFMLNDFLRCSEHFAAGHNMQKYYMEMDKDAEAVKAFLTDFIIKPEAFSPDFRALVQPVIVNFAQTYMRAPVFLSQQLANDVSRYPERAEILWQQCLQGLLESQSRCFHIRQLVREMSSRSVKDSPNFIISIMQYNQTLHNTGIIIDKIINILLARARLPRFNEGLLSLVDTLTLPTESETKDWLLTNTGFLKLMVAVRNYPEMFDDKQRYQRVYEWVSHPDNIAMVPVKLEHMANTMLEGATDKYRRPDDCYTYDLVEHSSMYDILLDYNKVLRFFYKMFAGSTNEVHKRLINQLTIGAWQYHVACMGLVETQDNAKIDHRNFKWFQLQLKEYYQSFSDISGALAVIFAEISQGIKPIGLAESTINIYRQNFSAHITIAMKVCYRRLLHQLVQPAQVDTDGALKTLQTFLNIVHALSQTSGRTSLSVDERLDFTTAEKINRYLGAISELLSEPETPAALHLVRALSAMEEKLIAALAEPHKVHDDTLPEEGTNLEDIWNFRCRLNKQFLAGKTLTDTASMLLKCIPKLPEYVSGGRVYRIQVIEILQKLLLECIERINICNISELLMGEPLSILVGHLKRASNSECQSVQEEFQPKVRKFEQWLKKSMSINARQSDKSLDAFDADLGSALFHITLRVEIKDKWQSFDVMALGQLLLKLVNNPKAEWLREKAFCQYARMLAAQVSNEPHGWVKAALGQLNSVLLVTPEHMEYMKRDEFFSQKPLIFVQLALRESLLWHDEGEIARANASIQTAEARLNEIAAFIKPEELSMVQGLFGTCTNIINAVNTYPQLLAFMENPCPPEVRGSYEPPGSSEAEDKTLLERFKNAWLALSANAGILHTRDEAKALFNAWMEEFKGTKSTVTLTLLSKRWTTHYQRFCESLKKTQTPVVKKISLPKAISEISKPKEAAVEKPMSMEERLRLKAIEKFNQKTLARMQSPNKTAKVKKSYKSGVRKKVESTPVVFEESSCPASSSEQLSAEKAVELSLPKAYRNPPLAQQTLEIIEKAGYKAFVTGGYVRDALQGLTPLDADILTDCPPEVLRTLFPRLLENSTYPGVFCRRKDGDNGCDLHLMSELPENFGGFKNSYILIGSNDPNKLYYVDPSGEHSEVRIDDFYLLKHEINSLRERNEDKLRLSAAQITSVITSNGGHTHDNDLVVDITSRCGETLQELTAGLDFTVNTFLVNAHNEFLVPVPASITDFKNKVLRTLIPPEESFGIDASRIFRLIRLTNQLGWKFDAETEQAARNAGHLLSRIEFFAFLKNFCKCFLNNRDIASKNLKDFLRLELLQKLFDPNPLNQPLDKSRKAFIESTFWQILDGPEEDRHVNLLALFSLAMMRSVTEIKDIMAQWIERTVSEGHKYKVGRIAKLLPERIVHYHSMLYPQKKFSMNPMALDFEPRTRETHLPRVQLSSEDWPQLSATRSGFFSHTAASSSSSWPARASSSSQQASFMP
ncbi:CCA tRNA nucleotidyltransferase [Legionella geestiana]|uniref:CCA tRNA nucleotidyltransferase n=1 Tax=Legionella geestiana TaxID=45065 RepID=UPI0010921BE7|nr:CCA tRNA nucleotidyltransferase [Legionella geestiana]QDQ40298.1 CCA tRNA nucleotidyltransferase [Legionella geestiana]